MQFDSLEMFFQGESELIHHEVLVNNSLVPESGGWRVVEDWKVVEDLGEAALKWSFVYFGQGSLVCAGQACS